MMWRRVRHCYWCGRRVRYDRAAHNRPDQATREHLIPLSLGGAKGHENIVVACRECNCRRGADTSWTKGMLRRARKRERERQRKGGA